MVMSQPKEMNEQTPLPRQHIADFNLCYTTPHSVGLPSGSTFHSLEPGILSCSVHLLFRVAPTPLFPILEPAKDTLREISDYSTLTTLIKPCHESKGVNSRIRMQGK